MTAPTPGQWTTCFEIGPEDPGTSPTGRFELEVDGSTLQFSGEAHIRVPATGDTIRIAVYGDQLEILGLVAFQVTGEPGPETFAGVVLFNEDGTQGRALGWYDFGGNTGRFTGPARAYECP